MSSPTRIVVAIAGFAASAAVAYALRRRGHHVLAFVAGVLPSAVILFIDEKGGRR